MLFVLFEIVMRFGGDGVLQGRGDVLDGLGLGLHPAQERPVRSCWGLLMTDAGSPCSTTTPPSMNTTWSATSRAKLISWVTTIMIMPSLASSRMTARTSPTSSGSRLVHPVTTGTPERRQSHSCDPPVL
jgi:hypothetical protein